MYMKTTNIWFNIPVLWLGTWKMGGERDADYSNDQLWIDNIKRCIDAGINLIDTAELYGNWHTEEIIGEAIKWYKRERLFITSKVFKTNLHYNNLIDSAKKSMERLRTDYIDLYLIHAPNPDINIEETMLAMNDLVKDWLVKNIWVSNFKKETLDLAQSFSKEKIVLNQCHYNLIFREPEISWLNEYCIKNNVIMQARRPLQLWEIINASILQDLSKKYNKTPAQIAINWLISQKNISTITKMTKLEHIKENLWALWWEMEIEDVNKLKKEYPGQQQVSDRVPLQ